VFEAATIKRGAFQVDFDVPKLLNTCMFYENVNLLIDPLSFTSLINQIGPVNFMSLLKSGHVSCQYVSEQIGTMNTKNFGGDFYNVGLIRGAGKLENPSLVDVIVHRISSNKNGLTPSRDFVERAVMKGVKSNISDAMGGFKEGKDMMFSFVENDNLFSYFLKSMAMQRGVLLTDSDVMRASISAHRDHHGIKFCTKVPIENIVPKIDQNDDFWSHLLNKIMDYTVDISFARKNFADMIVSDSIVDVTDSVVRSVIKKSIDSELEIERFMDFTVGNGKIIGEAYSTGRINFVDCLKLLDSAKKFKHWLRGVPVNSDLIKSYHMEVTKRTPLEGFSAKAIRYTVFSGVGLLIPPLSSVMGVVDSFVLDGLAKGWRPNIFIDKLNKKIS
jgi:hypothetical protein